jgi:hypothetical protein
MGGARLVLTYDTHHYHVDLIIRTEIIVFDIWQLSLPLEGLYSDLTTVTAIWRPIPWFDDCHCHGKAHTMIWRLSLPFEGPYRDLTTVTAIWRPIPWFDDCHCHGKAHTVIWRLSLPWEGIYRAEIQYYHFRRYLITCAVNLPSWILSAASWKPGLIRLQRFHLAAVPQN